MKDVLKKIAAVARADYAEIRLEETRASRIAYKGRNLETIAESTDFGGCVRALVNGGWGFVSFNRVEDVEEKMNMAIRQAEIISKRINNPTKLAPVKVVEDRVTVKPKNDPRKVALSEKQAILAAYNDIVLGFDKRITTSSIDYFDKFSTLTMVTSEGAEIEQDIIESGAGYETIATDGNEVQKRSFPNSHRGDFATRGYEFIEEMNLLDNVDKTREEAIQLLSADDCPDTETDIIITGSQMALQVHESCGHPSELDRVLGTEISLAGGSFMQIDGLNNLKYGSDIVNIYADATVPGGLGSFGYDDEGVKAQRSPIVKEGVHVGYLTSRETAPVIGQRSNGTMRADGWNRIPLIRMTNINLEPGEWELDDLIADTKDGIFFDMNKVWSIDDRRLNFQFGVECAWEIKNGKLGRIFKNPLYTGMTPQFWNSCDAICNRNHWHVWGVPNCGKGEPMQTARVAHGTSPARFRKVKVGVSK